MRNVSEESAVFHIMFQRSLNLLIWVYIYPLHSELGLLHSCIGWGDYGNRILVSLIKSLIYHRLLLFLQSNGDGVLNNAALLWILQLPLDIYNLFDLRQFL